MKPEILDDGWGAFNIWAHSSRVRELYARRCRQDEAEMTCHAQAAELLAGRFAPGDSVLDAGCGSGYFFHSLGKRGLRAEYFGIDATEALIEIGRREMPAFGLPADRLRVLRLEDFRGTVDHAVCINVLSNVDNYPRPLERLLQAARKSVILRESIKDGAEYRYVADEFLDEDVRLRVHVNAYDRAEIRSFIESYGFEVEETTDRYTRGKPETVIGYPHYWTFLVARRTGDREDRAGT